MENKKELSVFECPNCGYKDAVYFFKVNEKNMLANRFPFITCSFAYCKKCGLATEEYIKSIKKDGKVEGIDYILTEKEI